MVRQQDKKTTLHGTAVLLSGSAYPPSAVFLRGISGSGKSDLAFRLCEAGASLICDDQVLFERRQDNIHVSVVDSIRGLLEVRGVGLLRYPVSGGSSRLRLIVDLVPREEVPRLPEWEKEDILGVSVPRISLHAFDASAAFKVQKAMEAAHKPDILVG